MTWVPPYATNICQYRLNDSFGGMGMKNGLTHLGLQFWRPSEKDKIQLVGDFQPIDDASIIQFRKWGDTHKVQILLCVYNGYKDGWNWDLAKSAFLKAAKLAKESDTKIILSLSDSFCVDRHRESFLKLIETYT